MTTLTRLRILVFALFVCLYLLPLGFRPLMEPDETRYGEIPREMIATGNWVSPHLNGLRYFEKSPLGYWANGISILAFGENAFAVRLPSALSVGLSALLIMLLIHKAWPRDDEWAGPLAALVFLTSLEVFVIGTFAVLDSMLTASLTLTLVALFLASSAAPGTSRRQWLLIMAGVGCGLAFLIKGFLALVVPALVMGAYLAWERRWRDIPGLAWLPLLAATLTALPWGLAIHAQEPDFWRYFFWIEHVHRFMGGDQAQHQEPFWFFFLAAPVMFMPWTFLLPAAGLGIKGDGLLTGGSGSRGQDRNPRQLVRFSLAWLVLPFLFFSLSSGKLLTYILPCFPPFAILTGIGLLALLRAGRPRAFQNGAKAAATVFGLGALAFFVIQAIGVDGVSPPYTQAWQWLLGLTALLAMTLLPLAAHRAQGPVAKIILFGVSMTCTLGVSAFLLPARVMESKSPEALLLRHAREIGADTMILSDENSLRAVCWYLQRADVFMVNEAGELAYGLRYDEARGRLLTLAQAKAKIKGHPGKVVLVTRARNYHRWAPELPSPRTIDDNGQAGYILTQY